MLEKSRPIRSVEITNPRNDLPIQRGETFHGRDVFAPAAAHLHAIFDIGLAVDPSTLIHLPRYHSRCVAGEPRCETRAAMIDHFCNVILDLPASEFEFQSNQRDTFTLSTRSRQWSAKVTTALMYLGARAMELLLIVNSFGLMEIAKPTVKAAELLPVGLDDELDVVTVRSKIARAVGIAVRDL